MSTNAPPPQGLISPMSVEGTDEQAEAAPSGPAVAGVVRAAGGIVIRAASTGGWEVALIHRPLQQDWSLPKGKVDPDESAEECALREVLEETGWKCALGRFAGEVEYVDRRGRQKVVEYWLMQPIEGGYPRFAEVDELAWMPIAEAPARLSYEHDQALVASVARAMTVPGFHFDG